MTNDAASDATWAATGGSSGSRASAEELPAGAVVGRYVILSRLGAGGMGVVHAAYDPELDRKLALKVLRESAASTGRHRGLLREAQAAAKLNHPNVIAVHDVGEHEGRVYLAMELVEGTTLTQWIAAKPRPWFEVLDVFVQAGRGLAAAHSQGLVHRDFKPDNAMIGHDLRVRVMDFGLARASDLATEPDAIDTAKLDAMVGTPAYMAPEQHLGLTVGLAADQFAFCVALWEALYGERPFSGTSLGELSLNVTSGKRRPPPAAVKVPAWLRRACERGLATAAEDRFATMNDLLAALSRGRDRARTRTIVAVVGVLAVLASGVALGFRYQHARAVTACEDEGASIATTWNDDARTTLRDALVATGVPHALTTADKVTPWLDDHAQAWADARTQACMHASVEETWNADVLERSVWCLDERRLELEALVDELSSGEARSVDKAVSAAAALSRSDACLDRELLLRLPPPVEQRDALVAVRSRASHATTLYRTGVYAQGLDEARAALALAETVDWPPTTCAVRARVGMLLASTGAYDDAERVLEVAYFEAQRAGALDVAFEVADHLVQTVGRRLGRHAEGQRWARHVEVLLLTLPDATGLLAARANTTLALLHMEMGDLDRARELAEQALEVRSAVLGAEHLDVAFSLGTLGVIQEQSARFVEARALSERALAIRENTLGPEHPEVAASLNNLAIVHASLFELERAGELLERAIAIWTASLGPEHPTVARALTNLGGLHDQLGDYPRALALHQRAAASLEKALGPEHPHVAQALDHLAMVHLAIGEHERARAIEERVLAIREKALGPEHPLYARALNNLGSAHHFAGEHVRARALVERAIEITRKAEGPDHPEVAESLIVLGTILLATGDEQEARAAFEQALAIMRKAMGPRHVHTTGALVGIAKAALQGGAAADAVEPAEAAVAIRSEGSATAAELAEARFVLARALWEAGGDRSRAAELAAQAASAYDDETARGEVQRWIATHRAPGSRP